MVEGGLCIHITPVKAFFDRDRFLMAAYRCGIHSNVKGIHIRPVKIPDRPFGMDVFRAEEKILVFFQHVGRVVIGAVPPVADKDIPGTRQGMIWQVI